MSALKHRWRDTRCAPQVDRTPPHHTRRGDRLTGALEHEVLGFVRMAMPVLERRSAFLAVVSGSIGLAFGLIPLFFGLAWNFGGLATALALHARACRRHGDLRIPRLAIDAGFVLGVSAVIVGCGDLAVVLAGL